MLLTLYLPMFLGVLRGKLIPSSGLVGEYWPARAFAMTEQEGQCSLSTSSMWFKLTGRCSTLRSISFLNLIEATSGEEFTLRATHVGEITTPDRDGLYHGEIVNGCFSNSLITAPMNGTYHPIPTLHHLKVTWSVKGIETGLRSASTVRPTQPHRPQERYSTRPPCRGGYCGRTKRAMTCHTTNSGYSLSCDTGPETDEITAAIDTRSRELDAILKDREDNVHQLIDDVQFSLDIAEAKLDKAIIDGDQYRILIMLRMRGYLEYFNSHTLTDKDVIHNVYTAISEGMNSDQTTYMHLLIYGIFTGIDSLMSTFTQKQVVCRDLEDYESTFIRPNSNLAKLVREDRSNVEKLIKVNLESANIFADMLHSFIEDGERSISFDKGIAKASGNTSKEEARLLKGLSDMARKDINDIRTGGVEPTRKALIGIGEILAGVVMAILVVMFRFKGLSYGPLFLLFANLILGVWLLMLSFAEFFTSSDFISMSF